MRDCAFCRIAAGLDPADIIHADEQVVIVLDKLPIAKGQLLVFPRGHFFSLTAMPPEIVGAVMLAAARAGAALIRVADVDGYNLFYAQGPCAGQVINHLAVQVIPRRGDDRLVFPFMKTAGIDSGAEAAELLAKLRARFAAKDESTAEAAVAEEADWEEEGE
jgi:diadenosine tetraphosphate (Ap4A) HIT family hydrolase